MRNSKSNDTGSLMRPALTPESRENQLISLAIDRAEQQLRDGTASSQVITHYLKLGSTREQLEHERLIHENELLRAKTDSIKQAQKDAEMYDKVIAAMKLYSGVGGDVNEGEEYDEFEDDY